MRLSQLLNLNAVLVPKNLICKCLVSQKLCGYTSCKDDAGVHDTAIIALMFQNLTSTIKVLIKGSFQ
jgi:hypothetical protein